MHEKVKVSSFICRVNQLTGFSMESMSVLQGVIQEFAVKAFKYKLGISNNRAIWGLFVSKGLPYMVSKWPESALKCTAKPTISAIRYQTPC